MLAAVRGLRVLSWIVCVAGALAACGRIGFESSQAHRASSDTEADAGPDASVASLIDGGLGDASGAACNQAGPACGVGEYCFTPLGMCNVPGVCTEMPRISAPCSDQLVCGCDGVQYANGCAAARAGHGIAAIGPCPF